jgi:hypothetical protein
VIAGAILIAQLAAAAHAPPTAYTCEAIELTVAVTSASMTPPRVIVPPLGAFELLRQTPRSSVRQLSGGRQSVLFEYRFVIATDAPGRHQIPPFEVRGADFAARTGGILIDVTHRPPEAAVPSVVARARIDTSRRVSFQAIAEPDTVYVGEQAFYEVAVFLNGAVRSRLRRNPTFFPPDMVSMLAYDIAMANAEPPPRRIGRECFDALVYRRAIFPLVPGRHAIPPAQLVYSLPLGMSFFSREESFELRTDSTILIAVAPPAEARPPDYRGAVGRLEVDSRIESRDARVGDPIVVTVGVSGAGNVNLFPRPDLDIPWGALVPSGERVAVDSNAPMIGGRKEFDWILTPYQDGDVVVPEIRYPFFDPALRRYQTAVSDAIRIFVGPGYIATSDTIPEARLPLRTTYRGAAPAPLHERPWYWLLLAVMPIPAIVTSRRRRRNRQLPTVTPADRLAILARADSEADASTVRRLLGAALSERIGITAAALTSPDAVRRSLLRAGVTRETAADCDSLMRELEVRAFGRGGDEPATSGAAPGHDRPPASGSAVSAPAAGTAARGPETAGRRACEIFARIDAEALPRQSSFRWSGGGLSLALALVAGGAVAAHSLATPRELFDSGVAAFDAGHLDSARVAFGTVAALEKSSADAWMNYGTVSWHAHDTTSAVHGWQRALRLDPAASDARQRLDILGAADPDSPGDVVPLGRSTLPLAALLLWGIACALPIARAGPRRSPWISWTASAAFGVAAASVLLVGFALEEKLAGTDVVIVSGTLLRDSPGIGATASHRITSGAIARSDHRQGAWTLIDLGQSGRGWVESRYLLQLGDPPRLRSGSPRKHLRITRQ